MLLLVFAVALAGAAAQRPWTEEVVIGGDPVMRGLPRDAIPAIDAPAFVPARQAAWLRDDEPVIGVVLEGTARAYPVWLLDGHEIVNDTIAGRPVAVTW